MVAFIFDRLHGFDEFDNSLSFCLQLCKKGKHMIRVLIVDDHDLVRTGIKAMLSSNSDIEVVAEADCGELAICLTKQLQPDVILLDVNMPTMNGVDVTKKIKTLGLDSKILAISGFSQEPYPSMIVKAGADGYITKGTPIDEVVIAIKKTHTGFRYFSQDISNTLVNSLLNNNKSPFDPLSERERQVALMVANCQSIAQIADSLFVSAKTVNTYRYRIFEKLGIDSDVKLTHLAIRYGLVDANR